MDTTRTATPPLLHTIPGAVERISLSRSGIYSEIKAGRLRSVKTGGRTFIAEAELVRYVAELSA